MIRRLLSALRRRVSAEDGIVLLYALGAMVVILGLTGAALTAVTLDTSGTQSDTSQKQAYAAAEAGIQRYLFELNTNNTFWTACGVGTSWIVNTNASVPVTQAEPVNNRAAVPGSPSESYAVMLLPATGSSYTQCSTSDPVDSMIQASGNNAGTLRISSTGYAGNAHRTVVAAIRQQNFLDYAYFTNYETSDPIVQVDDAFASTNDLDTAIEPPDQCGSSPPTGCGNLYQTALTGGTVNGTTYPGAQGVIPTGSTTPNGQCEQYRSAGRENQPFFSNTYSGNLAYRPRIVADGPSSFWPLADTSGTTASDASGNGATGTYSSSGVTLGTTSPVESSNGKGVTLNGGTVTGSTTQQGPTVYSEEVWFKTTTAGGVLATFQNAQGNQDRLIYMTTAGKLAFAVYPGYVVTIQSPNSYNDGNWHFVVATQGSDGMNLYVDGQLVASNNVTTQQSYTGYWRLGGVPNSWPGASSSAFTGSESDAAWFSTELNSTQILNEYNASPVSPTYAAPSSGGTLTAYCTNIQFISNDQINGPFHSNDSVLMCGSPTFGRPSPYQDSIEFGGDSSVYKSGYLEAPGCSGSPTLGNSADKITPIDTKLNIPGIGSLASAADHTFSGTTCVNLTSANVQVASLSAGQSCIGLSAASYTSYAWSSFPNGVLYVAASSAAQCNYTYDVDDPVYTPTSSTVGCGTVFVSGQTQYPLTIGAAQDIVVDGNLTYPSPNTNNAMLGLIANGFIRVYHPVAGGICTSNGANNAFPSTNPAVTQISASMLSLSHSFIVDDYGCGAGLGTLTVNGAIAQNFRGTVGSGSGNAQSGYTKNYVYDQRLQYSEPPHFLAPTNGAYAIAYQTECETVASCDGTS